MTVVRTGKGEDDAEQLKTLQWVAEQHKAAQNHHRELELTNHVVTERTQVKEHKTSEQAQATRVSTSQSHVQA